ncbi:bifunctional glycosyltransferase family 2/GtrA family protein [Clostridium sp. Marseille-P2415]|uniref:bifunctional glycosyltransferase family 2/GtrA family protein n=1 Tax=Clostridium sp. Marseille-P2415 TaxID=1805471 RepID=UPI00135671F2|nr:bifunctional glycosyltransferase family 2/GtrA family protein [Clostridium sp. Marseille-P2415]
MKQAEKHSIILIPSLEPDAKLPVYIKELNKYGLSRIVIVDDGSGGNYQNIFNALENGGCTVLRHRENLGKGTALKTGFQFIKENLNGYSCIVTVDSDGQHAAKDVYKLIKEAVCRPDALLLGVRDFKEAGVPAKSLIGNRITSAAFAALYGRYLSDTQTGLRAFGPMLMDQMLAIKGSRFEYETQVLITCIRSKIPILTIPIQTIYENENRSTHFNAVGDSLKIIRIITSDFIKFFSSSIICSAIDLGIAWALLDLLKSVLQGKDFLRIIFATVAARWVSIAANYLLNKNFVFQDKQAKGRGLIRYLILCVINILLSAAGVYILHTALGSNEKMAKMICDTGLFIFSYQIQQRWVFRA